MMKIVVTDGYTLNPGDLSWKPIEAMGELTVYERTKPEEIVDDARMPPSFLPIKYRLVKLLLTSCPI